MDNRAENLQTYSNDLARTASPLITPAYFILGFLKWWYIDAVTGHLRFFKRAVELLLDRLSVGLLLKTFFVPWHRDKTVFGLAFGIIMRLIWLPLAFLVILAVILAGVLFVIGWLLLPIITVYNIIFFWI